MKRTSIILGAFLALITLIIACADDKGACGPNDPDPRCNNGQKPFVSLTAIPPQVDMAGDEALLSGDSDNAESCAASWHDGDVAPNIPFSENVVVNSDTSFTLTCVNRFGTSTASVNVTIRDAETPPPSGNEGSLVGFGIYGSGFMDAFMVTNGSFQWITTDMVHKGWPAISRDGNWLAIASTEGQCGDVSIHVMPKEDTAPENRVEVARISGTCVVNDGNAQTLLFLGDNRTVAYIGLDARSATEQRLVVFYMDVETGETWMSWLPEGLTLDTATGLETRRLHPSAYGVEGTSLHPTEDGLGVYVTVTDGVNDEVWRVEKRDGLSPRTVLLRTSAEKNPRAVDAKNGKVLLVGHNLTDAEDPRFSSHSLYSMSAAGGPITLLKQTADPGIESATYCGQNVCYLDWSRNPAAIFKMTLSGEELSNQEQNLTEVLTRIFDINEVRG